VSVKSPSPEASRDVSLEPVPVVAPHVSAGAAVRRYWPLVVACTLLLAAAGVALGLRRAPTYTATAQDTVSALAPSIAQVPGAVQAAQDLASSQSRLIDSLAIVGPLARRLDTSPEALENDLSATAVPDSTVIRIQARSSSPDRAIAIANGAARGLATYVNTAVKSDAAARRTLQRYEAASASALQALTAKRNVEGQGKHAPPGALVGTSAAAAAAELRRQALDAQYRNLVESQASAPNVQPFVLARDADSDRTSNAQILGFAGLVLGAVIGAGLATLLANRRARRAIA
jgi:capsular polysaccharide biosynthesis protein